MEERPGLTLKSLECGALVVGLTAVAGKAAVAGATKLYEHMRWGRYTPEQFEAATAPSSMVPYIAFALKKAEEYGLEVVIAGGIAKKALADPETVFDVENKTMSVSDDQSCLARRSATVLRPDEVTERDIDIFVKHMWVGEGEERQRVVADQGNPEIAKMLKEKAWRLQKEIDEYAKTRKLDLGPEISVFGYDAPYGHDFRLTDYATKTELSSDGKREKLYDNNGNVFEMPVDEQWTLIVGDLHVSVNSPQVQLGRTLNRTVVARERDIDDVNAAIRNLKNKGLWEGKMVSIWKLHQQFRVAMNESIRMQSITQERTVIKRAHLLGLKALAPLTGAVEDSPLLCPAIRDRRGWFSKISGKIMNASSGK